MGKVNNFIQNSIYCLENGYDLHLSAAGQKRTAWITNLKRNLQKAACCPANPVLRTSGIAAFLFACSRKQSEPYDFDLFAIEVANLLV